MANIPFDYNSISDLRRNLPVGVNGNIEIVIERGYFLELLRGYERYLEYTKALIQLEKTFQERINAMYKHKMSAAGLNNHTTATKTQENLRRHRDFIIAVLGD